jgi:SAM-dependent methyltransferase
VLVGGERFQEVSMPREGKGTDRAPQLAYSEIQHKTHDSEKRRKKADKIVRVLRDFLGVDPFDGLAAVDVGCSTGFTADALREAGAEVIGIDIDVPGLQHARREFGTRIWFVCADGARLPFADRSIDLVVFNHIYEHVVDPDAVMSEIARVLKHEGVVYLGLGNRRQIVEPHHRLPFLSWLPRGAADRYVATTGRAPSYYERFRTRSELLRMCHGLNLFDYTYTVLANAEQFAAQDVVPRLLRSAPPRLWHGLSAIVPTFIWIGTPGGRRPASTIELEPPRPVVGAR